MAKTRQELVYRALKDLGALPQGQTPNSQEYNSVDEFIEITLEDLAARDIVYIPDPSAIEERYFMLLGLCLAWNAAAEFGAHNDAGLAALAQKAELDLKAIERESDRYLNSRTMHTEYPIHRRCSISSTT